MKGVVKMKLVKLGFALMIFFVSMISFSTSGSACSCMPNEDPATELQRYDAVFAGKVIGKKKNPNDSMEYLVKMEVSKAWKEVEHKEVWITTSWDSASCGINFETDKEYIVYGMKQEDGQYNVNLCSRTALLDDATEDLDALGEGYVPSKEVEQNQVTSNINDNEVIVYGLGLIVVVSGGILLFRTRKNKD